MKNPTRFAHCAKHKPILMNSYRSLFPPFFLLLCVDNEINFTRRKSPFFGLLRDRHGLVTRTRHLASLLDKWTCPYTFHFYSVDTDIWQGRVISRIIFYPYLAINFPQRTDGSSKYISETTKFCFQILASINLDQICHEERKLLLDREAK